MNILIVEDDEKVGQFLRENLVKDNYIVTIVKTIPELETYLQSKGLAPEVIILDRLIENSDTKNYLKKIKTRFPESRILYLSALNTPSEKASLLDEGADDYLGKPFSLVELQARVRSLGRRKEDKQQNFYLNIGDIMIDMKLRSARCGEKKIDLSNKEYALLINFSQNENRVFSKFQLLDIIWETNLDIESNVLEVTIMNLRKKLDEGLSKVKIQSKRNVGYWLET